MPVSKRLVSCGVPGFPEPYWSSSGAALYLGDVRTCLRAMPARSVHCVITSPPYWGLRDYGTGTWDGGSVDCDHIERTAEMAHKASTLGPTAEQRTRGDYSRVLPVSNAAFKATVRQYTKQCKKCGAKRTDMQIGADPSPDCGTHGQAQCGACYVCTMVEVFSEVRRVLRDDGTCWLNLGDTYSGGSSGQNLSKSHGSTLRSANYVVGKYGYIPRPPYKGLASSNLVGIPWRVALALQADGWVLRQDIIWGKLNTMPESVTDRCTKSHEHIFLLAKGGGYYYDSVAIQEPAKSTTQASRNNRTNEVRGKRRGGGSMFGKVRHAGAAIAAGGQCREYDGGDPDFVNKRDVWIVPITGYPGAHFATYSPRLITPCILAGTSEYGCCAACGRPYERIVVRVGAIKYEGDIRKKHDRSFDWSRNGVDSTLHTGIAQRETAGWRKMCGCQTNKVSPCVVLDLFIGSGTTVATAIQLGRAGVGIDLSEVYLQEHAIPRIKAAICGEKIPRREKVLVQPTDVPPTPQRLR